MSIGKRALMLVVAASLLVGLLAPSLAVSASQADVEVLRIDDYSQEVEMGHTVTYYIAVYNNGTTSIFIDVNLTNNNAHWKTNATPAYFTLGPAGYQNIQVKVTAPNTRDYPVLFTNVTLSVTDLVVRTHWEEAQTIETDLEGGGVKPVTKILNILDNPFDSGFLSTQEGLCLLNVIATAIVAALLFFVFPPIAKKITSSTETELDDMIIEIVREPVTLLFILYGVITSIESLNLSWSTVNSVNLFFDVTYVFAGAFMIYKIFKDIVIYYAKKMAANTETELDDVIIPILEWLGAILIIFGAVGWILRDFGIDITLIVTGMGMFGIVIGFAMQESLGNFISGMFLLTDRPFKNGDDIQLPNGDYCKVVHVGMRTTKLYRGATNDVVIVPNRQIANESIVNLMEPDRMISTSVKVGVAYGTDIDKVRAIMLTIAKAHPDIIKDKAKEPVVRFSEFGDSAVNVAMFFTVKELGAMWRVQAELRESIYKKFSEAGIDIPFPQHVVYVKGQAPPVR